MSFEKVMFFLWLASVLAFGGLRAWPHVTKRIEPVVTRGIQIELPGWLFQKTGGVFCLEL